MIKSIDHIVILVADLAQATTDYTALGFTVVPGGEHTGGVSHNALIAFQDGSYIELIAFLGPIPHDHFFYREGVTEGLITYALLPSDIEADVAEIRARGLAYEGPRPGGRLRPDGQRIEWQIATPPSRDLPFLCFDLTPRALRVPQGEAQVHANGATGIHSLTIDVNDLDRSIERYEVLFGDKSEHELWVSTGQAAIVVGETDIRLVSSSTLHEGPADLSISTGDGSIIKLISAHIPDNRIPKEFQYYENSS